MSERAGFLSISGAARFFSVSPKTIRRLISAGHIRRYVRLERAIRIPVAELDRYARARMVETAPGGA